LVYARAVLGHCSSKLAMDENLTWNPTWQKWIMMMGKFSSPSKMLNFDIFSLNYFSKVVIFILDICVSCTSFFETT
jgi:hypothetical protein